MAADCLSVDSLLAEDVIKIWFLVFCSLAPVTPHGVLVVLLVQE